MFVRKLRVEWVDTAGEQHLCPVAWIDSFAMREVAGNAVFDDTLPIDDGLLEAGLRVPLDALHAAMDDWFRRKGYLHPGERLVIEETDPPAADNADKTLS